MASAAITAAKVAGSKTVGRFTAFSGVGHRLDGKSKTSASSLTEMEVAERSLPPLVVDTNYIPGKLEFVRWVFVVSNNFFSRDINNE